MEELEQILIEKMNIYKSLYMTADEIDNVSAKKHYGRCIKKIGKMIKIL
ncbi:hypothetical protein [Patiriisocius marinus]|nr:hypothetical protein [Patiriisocius marinus]